MGRRPKMIFDFLELPVMDKILFYRNILNRLKANADTFARPDKDISSVEQLVKNLESKYIAAASGFYAPTVAMRTAEKFADDAFRILAGYVNRVAKGDPRILALSGFVSEMPLALPPKEKSPNHAQPLALRVKNGPNPGSVELFANAVERGRAYIWQYVKDIMPSNESEWVTGYSTRLRYEIDELVVGSGYYFRVAAITPDGPTQFTKAISIVVK